MDDLTVVSEGDLADIMTRYALDSAEQADLTLFILMAQEGEVKQAWEFLKGASEKVHTAVDSLIRSWA